MKSVVKKSPYWTAIIGFVTGVAFFVTDALNRFVFFDSEFKSFQNLWWAIVFLLVVIWLTGTALIHKKELKITGLIGYVLASMGDLSVCAWCIVNYNQGNRTWELWNAVGLFLCVWGLLAFGVVVLSIGKYNRVSTLLWWPGLLMMFAGMGYNWSGRLYMVAVGVFWCSIDIWIKRNVIQKTKILVEEPISKYSRFVSLDMHKGLIMGIMAIDHASALIVGKHPFEMFNLPLPSYFSDSAEFLTRFVTHICAPGFFFLMGTGIILFANSREKSGWSTKKIVTTLMIRGALIIALEKILINPILTGSVGLVSFGVLFGLGGSMIVCSLFIKFNRFWLLFIGVAGIIITQMLPDLILGNGITHNSWVVLFLLPKISKTWNNLYPILPWMSISVLGMLFGKELLMNKAKAFSKILIAGFSCLFLFFILRYQGGFGNIKPVGGSTWIDFFNVIKYPPALVFSLLMLGINFIFLYSFERFHHHLKILQRPLIVFGCTALFYYFIHWYLFSGMFLLFLFVHPNVPMVYAGWATGLAILYPICNWFLKFKQQESYHSIWRMV